MLVPAFLHGQDSQTEKKVLDLSQKVEAAIQSSNADQAVLLGIEAVNLSLLASPEASAKAMLALSRAYQAKGSYGDALDYAIQASTLLEGTKNERLLAETLFHTGKVCYQWRAYSKSIKYLQQALAFYQQPMPNARWVEGYEIMAQSCMAIDSFAMAEKLLLSLKAESNEPHTQGKTLRMLSKLALSKEDYPLAVTYATAYLELQEKLHKPKEVALAQHDLGFLYRKLGQNELALTHLELAKNGFSDAPLLRAAAIENIGVTYTHLKLYGKADEAFQEALAIYTQENNAAGIAHAHNYWAVNQYLQGQPTKAIKLAEIAAQTATANNLPTILADANLLLYEAYTASGDFKRSQEAYKNYAAIKKLMEDAKNKSRTELSQIANDALARENQSKLLISDKETQLLQLSQQRLEAEKQSKELELLKQSTELQGERIKNEGLQKQQAENALKIAQQQLEAARKEKEIAELERQKDANGFALLEKSLEEKERRTQIELLSQQNAYLEQADRLKDLKLGQEHTQVLYSYGIAGLLSLLLLVAIFAFIRNQRQKNLIIEQNRELEAQKEAMQVQQMVITEKNEELMASEEELRQGAEELMTINDQLTGTLEALKDQKRLVDKKNTDITASINYARRIQNAILPNPDVVGQYFSDFFVLYKPRDIVSGDFYWFSHTEGKLFIAAVDCTGHGVPGAFMSLIGATLLNDIVSSKHVYDPGEILDLTHVGVIHGLRQQETESRDGMDGAICMIDLQERKLHFSGANNPMVYIQDGELHEVKGDRYAIGGSKNLYADHFKTHTVDLAGKTTHCYLFSDGFQDQFGGTQDKKYMRKRLKSLLFDIHQKPYPQQEHLLAQELQDWMSHEHKQIDDILVVGFKLAL